jgi:hypothetical protein
VAAVVLVMVACAIIPPPAPRVTVTIGNTSTQILDGKRYTLVLVEAGERPSTATPEEEAEYPTLNNVEDE